MTALAEHNFVLLRYARAHDDKLVAAYSPGKFRLSGDSNMLWLTGPRHGHIAIMRHWTVTGIGLPSYTGTLHLTIDGFVSISARRAKYRSERWILTTQKDSPKVPLAKGRTSPL